MNNAQKNSFDFKNNCQNCYIIGPTGPKGDIGPTGPTGPTGPASTQATSTYATKYDTTANTIQLTANTISTITLSKSGPNSGINNEINNGFKIIDSGIYKIDYLLQGSSNVEGTLTIEVINSTVPISSSTITKEVTANEDETLSGSIIVSLATNDEITLGIESTATSVITLSNGTSTYLNIIKLG